MNRFDIRRDEATIVIFVRSGTLQSFMGALHNFSTTNTLFPLCENEKKLNFETKIKENHFISAVS